MYFPCLGPFSRAIADQTIDSIGVGIFEKVHSRPEIWSFENGCSLNKFKNFCAHHEANDKMIVLSTKKNQKSHLGTKFIDL